MSLEKVNEEWIPLQNKVFTRWVQNQLHDVKGVDVNDISKDLSNGVALVELARVLTRKQASRSWAESPKRNVDMVQNCDLAVDMFAKDGVRLVGISGKDINDNNQKLILGLIWSLILHYSIGSISSGDKDNNMKQSKDNASVKNNKQALMSWAIDRTADYPGIHNFAPYELSLCALLDSFVPNKINFYSLNPADTQHNFKLATDVMQELGIPVYVFPEDCEDDGKIDEKALLTQLSSAKAAFDSPQLQQIIDSEKVGEKMSDNDDMKEDEKEETMKQQTATEEETQRLTQQIAESMAKEEAKEEELANTKAQLQSEIDARSQAQSEVNRLKGELESAEAKRNELMDSISRIQQEDKQEIGRLNTEIDKLNGEIDKLKSDLANSKARVQALEESSEDVDHIKAALAESQLQNQKLSEKLTETQDNLSNVWRTLKLTRINDKNEITSLHSKIDDLQKELSKTEQIGNDILQSYIESHYEDEAKFAELKHQISVKEEQAEEMLQVCLEERDSAMTQMDDLKVQITNLKQQLAT